jgi:2,3-dihydroxybenzoate decarboxylase
MDKAGIEIAVLSTVAPGVQIETDTATAVRLARVCNDFLAEKIATRPDRYRGFAHLALQDPKEAAKELDRCVRQLGLCGAMINGHSNGRYLDESEMNPFWERVEELQTVVYLHPADPATPNPTIGSYRELARATWGWGVETGTHALRLVFGGVFDRFPNVKLALGHLGETLPFLLWRIDSRAKIYGVKLKRNPSEYLRDNMIVTLSGMYSLEPLVCTINALGLDNVMFSADYPFESIDFAASFMDDVDLPLEQKQAIAYDNAARFLKLR